MYGFDPRRLPNGTVLLLGISYRDALEPSLDATRGMTPAKVYTYALLKAGGLWHASGTGRVPQGASWGAVERWLAVPGRHVEWIEVVTERRRIYPVQATAEQVSLPAVDTSQSSQ